MSHSTYQHPFPVRQPGKPQASFETPLALRAADRDGGGDGEEGLSRCLPLRCQAAKDEWEARGQELWQENMKAGPRFCAWCCMLDPVLQLFSARDLWQGFMRDLSDSTSSLIFL